ncbi:MAG: hypothetical protein IPK93_05205 [Solirubrobacterales bacterium]|nr:hypothetical protein [Solirubrobacterales bacterium]
MNREILWKSALVQLLAVAAVSIVLAILLPKSFFEDWGWVSGPTAWILCALFTATVLKLPRGTVVLGAILAGVPSVIAVFLGVHWLGALLATAFFAVWCAYRAKPAPAR